MVNVGELMGDVDFARSITRRRPTTTVVADGTVADGTESTTYADLTITAIVEPAKPDDLEMLPEGTRLAALRAVWSASELRAGDGDTLLPDVLVIDSQSFLVLHVSPRPESGYYRALALDYPAGTATEEPEEPTP